MMSSDDISRICDETAAKNGECYVCSTHPDIHSANTPMRVDAGQEEDPRSSAMTPHRITLVYRAC
jgi:hypothetical protein